MNSGLVAIHREGHSLKQRMEASQNRPVGSRRPVTHAPGHAPGNAVVVGNTPRRVYAQWKLLSIFFGLCMWTTTR